MPKFFSSRPSDDKFIQEKDSLIQGLEDIAEYLGDDDAKKVTLRHTALRSHVSVESANSKERPSELEELEGA